MSAVEVILIALNSAGFLSFIAFILKLYSDVQVIKKQIEIICKKIEIE